MLKLKYPGVSLSEGWLPYTSRGLLGSDCEMIPYFWFSPSWYPPPHPEPTNKKSFSPEACLDIFGPADARAGGCGRRPISISENTIIPRDAWREAHTPIVGIPPELSLEAKSPRAANGDSHEGCGVDASSFSTLLNLCSAENSAARGYPAVGIFAIPPGVLTWRYILSRPAWQARRANGILEGDAANQG